MLGDVITVEIGLVRRGDEFQLLAPAHDSRVRRDAADRAPCPPLRAVLAPL